MSRIHTLALVALAPTILMSSPLHAQLRLPKVQNPITGRPVGTPAVTYDDVVLEITPKRLEQFRRGLMAEQAMLAQVEAQDLPAIEARERADRERYEQERAAYETAVSKREACVAPIVEAGSRQQAAQAPGEGEQAALEKVAARIRAAAGRNDLAEVRRLTDSVAAIGNARGSAITTLSGQMEREAMQKCGPLPTAPARPERESTLSYSDVQRAGVEASGFTDRQYRVMRERIAPVVLGTPNRRLAYGGKEQEAIAGATWLPDYADLLRRF